MHSVRARTPVAFPHADVPVHQTQAGTRYLRGPGVVMVGQTVANVEGIQDFLGGFGDEFRGESGGIDYVGETFTGRKLPFVDQLCKFAGQLCYMSLGQKRTKNTDAAKYFENIREYQHGSVMEHGTFSFLFYGVDRTFTHEAVRHRMFSFSQTSQRYVGAGVLRFVERPEYQNDPDLHRMFEARIDMAAQEYSQLADVLLDRQAAGDPLLVGERRTEARKNVQQAARSCLPGETEAPIVMTGNVRAWRHFLEMRASSHADKPIRLAAMKVYRCLIEATDLLADYRVVSLPDGTEALETDTRKV